MIINVIFKVGSVEPAFYKYGALYLVMIIFGNINNPFAWHESTSQACDKLRKAE